DEEEEEEEEEEVLPHAPHKKTRNIVNRLSQPDGKPIDLWVCESSEGDSSYQNSADEDYAYHQKLKVAKVEAVIPPSLKSQLTVTPAGAVTNTNTTTTTTTINNNSIHNVNANGGGGGGGLVEELHIDYKEKYEQTLKELFACRKIVKNQNKAIQQQQKEIDFLNLLLKEK
uniref:Uncharacterized protein n=1 Tax=Anopheles melas TaxID=34690 RepID=A0A182UK08_9DIPT